MLGWPFLRPNLSCRRGRDRGRSAPQLDLDDGERRLVVVEGAECGLACVRRAAGKAEPRDLCRDETTRLLIAIDEIAYGVGPTTRLLHRHLVGARGRH